MDRLTLLTTTGERPEAWKICEMLMRRQTCLFPVRWVVVDDGKIQQPITFERDNWKIEVVRPEPFWTEGANTQARNILSGLSIINKNERVIVIEDDDWYDPRYLAYTNAWLDVVDMVGEAPSRYFNVSTGCGKLLTNYKHSGLCSTAVKGKALEALRASSKQNLKFIDMVLWRNFRGTKKLCDSRMVVGIKGMPGRRGIGCGHNPKFGDPMNLRGWIGSDVEIYSKFMPESNVCERVLNVA